MARTAPVTADRTVESSVLPNPGHLIVFATSEAAEEAFYAALARADLNAVMALWADDEDIVCIHPGGPRLTGVAAIRESYAAILSEGPLRLAIESVRVQTGAITAVHSLIERIAVPGAAGGRSVCLVVTNVYMKGAEGWRIVVHHASPSEEPGRVVADRPPGRLH